jgi:hypothetical protein
VSGFQIGYPVQLSAFWIRPGMREVGNHGTANPAIFTPTVALSAASALRLGLSPDPCNAQRECDGPRLSAPKPRKA